MNNYNKLKDEYSELTGMTYEDIDKKVEALSIEDKRE